jgi:hypothetical protein
VDEMWDGVKSEIEEVIDAGNPRYRDPDVRGLAPSGVRLDMQVFQVVTLRDVRQVTGGYRSRGEVLHAAGLTE